MQISDHIHALKIPFQITISPQVKLDRFAYTYLIYSSKGITLIDTGVAGKSNLIFNYITETGRKPDDINMIIQTHGHPDHIGTTKEIKAITGCTVAIHKAEQVWLEDIDTQFKERPVPGFYDLIGGSAKVDLLLQDGDIVDCGDDIKIEVIHTPGHSKGSISLMIEKEQVLISGDAIILPGDLPFYDDSSITIASVKKLCALAGVHTLLSSWDEPKTSNISEILNQGLEYLQDIDAIVKSIYLEGMEPMELCKRTVEALKLPPVAVMPIAAKAFLSSVTTQF